MGKARLCNCAAKETRQVMNKIKDSLLDSEDLYDMALGEMLMPPCEMYGNCFEPNPCKKWTK